MTGPSTAGRVPAVGGVRTVPAPDPIARDYLLLALRLDQRINGLVDGYFGPAELKATVEIEQMPAPQLLREDASTLRSRLSTEVHDGSRRLWLDAQLTALERHAADLAGEKLPYLEHVSRCFDWLPSRRSPELFDRAAADLDALVPGDGDLSDRLAAWDERFVVGRERLQEVFDWLVELFRGRAAAIIGLPAGEDLRTGLVSGQPWSAYNWYDGGLRSRIDINTDLPTRAGDLLRMVAHEAYPGHHLEHAWKETDLVESAGRLEASVLLINTPECLISEGLADIGIDLVLPRDERPDILVELYERSGLAIAGDRIAGRRAAERQVEIGRARRVLGAAEVNAALMRHADGVDSDTTLAYLIETGRMAPDRAAKVLSFIEHPLWRTYIFVYYEGEALLRRWLEAVPPGAASGAGRFARLLHEAVTPAGIAAEIESAI